jgi:alkanesulfonate monooxygenase SsuD/methylene tetrahydromethanopterin reductase-like flavin-dependent oxidoreductase (luciferase family)
MSSPDSTRKRTLKIGLVIPYLEYGMAGTTPRWTDLRQMAQYAETLGFDSLWLHDHLLFPSPRAGEPFLGTWECWSILTALAAVTTRIELGTTVLCTNFRNPALLAKMADTTDEISGGRLILGLGAGYSDLEFRAFGYPVDQLGSRFEEALIIIHALLREGQINFEGQYYQAHECVLRPRGPRPKGPPILIGSQLGPRMLRLTARYADMWNAWTWQHHNSPAGIAPLRAAVDTVCIQAGRDPHTLERTAAVLVEFPGAVPYPEGYPGWAAGEGGQPVSGPPEEIAEIFRAYAHEGISHLQVWVNPWSVSGLEALAAVLKVLDRD